MNLLKVEYRDWKITSFYPGGFDTDSTIDELQEDVDKRSPGTLGVREIVMSVVDIASKPGNVSIGSIGVNEKLAAIPDWEFF
ncbi:MAG: hypothetical protein QNJ27_04550 [Simkaniaceae bacterium]|nr:hypothetical protein [Simkaniaceae bacterium]